MSPFRNFKLVSRVNLVVAAILLLFFLLTLALDYRRQQEVIIAESVAKARLLAAGAIHAREYLSAELLRGDVTLSDRRFGLIPVVAADRIIARIGDDLGYGVRQVSSRFRNPRNAPDPFETATLIKFVSHPELKEAYGFDDTAGERVFRYLQPFRADGSCLECHGEPAAAPAFIRAAYPPERDRAYHYRLGEIIGAASVRISVASLDRQILANLRDDALQTAAVFLALVACLGLLMRTVVTRPLGRLGTAIGEVEATGRLDQRLPPRGSDEIGTLTTGFNRMMDKLQASVEQLEESERRFHLLTDTARDAIVCFLANGQIILFNVQAVRLFGYSRTDAIGLRVDALIHPDCHELAGRSVEAFLAGAGETLPAPGTPLAGRRRDGTRLRLELSLSAAESDGHRFYTAILRETS
ncbi:MAG: hypothetical protein A2005_02300 [Desulfuromonadales bacterium GWC2_61_20]|nr:MAG: hypothetical protein A2005_02300 [Desulfuromonadales bacterium GWC2_61_20]HAD03429.1 hypothetical protein [Desulfuromonas sp.]